MQQRYFLSLGDGGSHRIAYADWGDPSSPRVVVCVHGLARNSRDFDCLADELTPECRVLCMDVVGRGESDWLEHKNEYTFATYQRDAAAMLARAGATAVDWVGTSMGGLIGMFLAARPNSPIRRLVLNDVGALEQGDLSDAGAARGGFRSAPEENSRRDAGAQTRPGGDRVPGVGHAPALMNEEQIGVVKRFLLER